MSGREGNKIIQLDEQTRRQLKKMAGDKDLKTFIEDLLGIMVEFHDYASAKWLIKQANKK